MRFDESYVARLADEHAARAANGKVFRRVERVAAAMPPTGPAKLPLDCAGNADEAPSGLSASSVQ